MISFFEEFLNDSCLKKLGLIDFDTKIYLGAKDIGISKHIKKTKITFFECFIFILLRSTELICEKYLKIF